MVGESAMVRAEDIGNEVKHKYFVSTVYFIIYLLSNLEICEHLKIFGNVYCVISNHIGDQDMSANHRPQTN